MICAAFMLFLSALLEIDKTKWISDENSHLDKQLTSNNHT